MSETRHFSDFGIGDCVVFEKAFTKKDFESFSNLSGDRNPFHWDEDYAGQTDLGRTIVPMHMTMAPLSMVAGMIFPGDPSLYLGHEVHSVSPVFYGDALRYSAKIVALNESHQILSLRVLAIRGSEVVLDASMTVQCRHKTWEQSHKTPGKPIATKRALVSGASGEIGSALALGLARQGWNLLLQYRGNEQAKSRLEQQLTSLTAGERELEFFKADLCAPEDVDALCKRVAASDDIALVIHVASPPVTSALSDLVQVNYAALKRLAEAAAPTMLARQNGVIVNIGSIATERVIKGWADYSAAKAMSGQLVTSIGKANREFGIRGLTVLAGLVATRYSEEFRDDSPALLPNELAEAILEQIGQDSSGDAFIVEWNGSRCGRLGFHQPSAIGLSQPAVPVAGAHSPEAFDSAISTSDADARQRIAEIVSAKLALPDVSMLADGGLGITPGWDSLRHLELLLELERQLGVSFKSGDMSKMLSFSDLMNVVLERISQNVN
jgi:NAD(P)-dependent dehydrogenase (short-subunit alcohol dehydrogenase family)/acyl dehydratase/acyl carrier protein